MEQLLERFADGHEVRQDRRQWIVKHPQTCRNAKRGNLLSSYAKFTYLTSPEGFQKELRECHLTLSGAHPQRFSRLDNGRSDQKRPPGHRRALGALGGSQR